MAFFDIFNNRKKLQKLQQEKKRQEFDQSIVDLRNNIIYTCHQFAGGNEERLFIICAGQDDVEWFYQLWGMIFSKYKMNQDGVKRCDTSDEAVQQCRDRIAADWQKVLQLCADNNVKLPKGCRMMYDNRFDTYQGKFVLDREIDVNAEAIDWMNEEKQKLKENGPLSIDEWLDAYRPKARCLEKDGEVIGAFPLREGTDTVLPVDPQASYEGKEIKKWVLSLVSTTENRVIARVDYRIALAVLQESVRNEIISVVSHLMLVKGLSREQMEQLVEKCSRVSEDMNDTHIAD